jgi:hypothetical protein
MYALNTLIPSVLGAFKFILLTMLSKPEGLKLE